MVFYSCTRTFHFACRTADEDFNILLEAALMYDRRVSALLGENDSVLALADNALNGQGKSSPFPRLLLVVTGKSEGCRCGFEKLR